MFKLGVENALITDYNLIGRNVTHSFNLRIIVFFDRFSYQMNDIILFIRYFPSMPFFSKLCITTCFFYI